MSCWPASIKGKNKEEEKMQTDQKLFQKKQKAFLSPVIQLYPQQIQTTNCSSGLTFIEQTGITLFANALRYLISISTTNTVYAVIGLMQLIIVGFDETCVG